MAATPAETIAAADIPADADAGDGIRVADPLGQPRLRFVRTVALSVGIQGPTAGVIVGPAVLAGIVGGSGALAYLLGLVAMGFGKHSRLGGVRWWDPGTVGEELS